MGLMAKLSLLCLVVYGMSYTFEYLFVVKQAECYDSSSRCEDSLDQIAQLSLGRNLVLEQFDDLITRLGESQVDIKQVTLERKLPGKVEFRLGRAEILGIIEASGSARLAIYSNLYATDSAGLVDPNMIEVTYDHHIKPGQKIDDSHLVNSFRLLDQINQSYVGYEKYLIASDSAVLVLDADSRVLFDPSGASRSTIVVLQLLLKDFGDKLPYLIDLRYNQPTVTYQAPASPETQDQIDQKSPTHNSVEP